jgi:hypothetical protein
MQTIQNIMWHYVGIVRSGVRLSRAIRELRHLQNEIEMFYRTTKLNDGLSEKGDSGSRIHRIACPMIPGAASGTKWLGTIMPEFPWEQLSPCGAFRSTTVTFQPFSSAKYAVDRPMMPPPTMTKSFFVPNAVSCRFKEKNYTSLAINNSRWHISSLGIV